MLNAGLGTAIQNVILAQAATPPEVVSHRSSDKLHEFRMLKPDSHGSISTLHSLRGHIRSYLPSQGKIAQP